MKRAVLLWIPLLLLMLFTLFPFWWMIATSLKPDAELYDVRQPPLWVKSATLEHYRELFTRLPFVTWVKNSLMVATAATLLSLVIGALAGYSLARLRFRGATTLGTIIFAAYLVPTTLLFLPLAYVVRWLGLYNTPFALIVTYPTFLVPFCSWYLMGYFKSIPRELEECAMTDGCTRSGAFVRIVLPLATPGILSAAIFAFTFSWNEFIYALTFVQAPAYKTVPVGVVGQLATGDVLFWGKLMAAAVLGSIPIALIYSTVSGHFAAGMTAGALKG
ncbi:MAG: carbohydrate ABC transporter permease [Candidatus Rokubacteria bacterium]|nr:carbohydrate ABC transporter permease [Candidatus Rokubacteria bacterium]